MLQILTMRLLQAKWTGNFETLGSKFRHETEGLLPSFATQVKSHHSNALSYTHVQRNGLDAVALVALRPKGYCRLALLQESPII